MARRVVTERGISVRLACKIFTVSETCYRYEAKKNAENEQIADWLLRLTDNHRKWGFGLCYLYLRNVKGFKWNHKRIYRIHKELELNLRIKPRKRLNREKPEPLAVPEEINQVWSRLRYPMGVWHYNHDRLNMALGGSTPKQRLAMAA
jgi:putative transposase